MINVDTWMLVEIINIFLRLKRNHIFPVCLILLILVCVIQLDFGIYYVEWIGQVDLAFVI